MEQNALRAAEDMAREAVTSIVVTLCGKSDQKDRFTGLQREMDLVVSNAVRCAFAAGKETIARELHHHEFRMQKALEKQAEAFEQHSREGLERARRRMESMCKDLENQQDEFRSALAALKVQLAELQSSMQGKARLEDSSL